MFLDTCKTLARRASRKLKFFWAQTYLIFGGRRHGFRRATAASITEVFGWANKVTHVWPSETKADGDDFEITSECERNINTSAAASLISSLQEDLWDPESLLSIKTAISEKTDAAEVSQQRRQQQDFLELPRYLTGENSGTHLRTCLCPRP